MIHYFELGVGDVKKEEELYFGFDWTTAWTELSPSLHSLMSFRWLEWDSTWSVHHGFLKWNKKYTARWKSMIERKENEFTISNYYSYKIHLCSCSPETNWFDQFSFKSVMHFLFKSILLKSFPNLRSSDVQPPRPHWLLTPERSIQTLKPLQPFPGILRQHLPHFNVQTSLQRTAVVRHVSAPLLACRSAHDLTSFNLTLMWVAIQVYKWLQCGSLWWMHNRK